MVIDFPLWKIGSGFKYAISNKYTRYLIRSNYCQIIKDKKIKFLIKIESIYNNKVDQNHDQVRFLFSHESSTKNILFSKRKEDNSF